MKQNNYTRMAAVYTGIALVNLIAVFCVLRRLPDPLYLFGTKPLRHWFFAGLAIAIALYFPLILTRLKNGVNADKNYPMISHAMRIILPLQFICLWGLLLAAKPEPEKSAHTANLCWGLAIAESIALILLSNHLPRLRPNGVLGLRDPWTVKNAVCWTRTHRFAGKLFVCTGITALAALLIVRVTVPANDSPAVWILYAELFVMLIPPHIYAYRHRNDAE